MNLGLNLYFLMEVKVGLALYAPSCSVVLGTRWGAERTMPRVSLGLRGTCRLLWPTRAPTHFTSTLLS